ELELEFARQVLPLELLVLADVRRDHLAHLSRLEQLAEAETVDAGVVRNAGQVLHAGVAQGRDQRLGDAAQAEAADGDRLAVGDHSCQGGSGAREYLAHRCPRTGRWRLGSDYKGPLQSAGPAAPCARPGGAPQSR